MLHLPCLSKKRRGVNDDEENSLAQSNVRDSFLQVKNKDAGQLPHARLLMHPHRFLLLGEGGKAVATMAQMRTRDQMFERAECLDADCYRRSLPSIPGGPERPFSPYWPGYPGRPTIPAFPGGLWSPRDPRLPGGPAMPTVPGGPFSPGSPTGLGGPLHFPWITPGAPALPGGPLGPGGPGGPAGPR
uniref:Collagen alpha-1(I) chain-like n=1 Tax=Ascaris lumbricoides TaxID=6252 RepID=A0A0M3IJZ8_ASCLU